jgi:EpsI family protein
MRWHLHPAPTAPQAHVLEQIPEKIGQWVMIPSMIPPVNPERPDALGRPGHVYDDVVSRTYVEPDGTQIMLMLAYQSEQRQEDRVHSPELCYYAQGFILSGRHDVVIPLAHGTVPARAFTGTSLNRREDVIYWIRTGNELRSDSVTTRLEILTSGLDGRIDDGILVRASMTDNFGPMRSAATKQDILMDFLRKTIAASPSGTRVALIGHLEG